VKAGDSGLDLMREVGRSVEELARKLGEGGGRLEEKKRTRKKPVGSFFELRSHTPF